MSYKKFETILKELISIKESSAVLNEILINYKRKYNFPNYSKYEALIVACLQDEIHDYSDRIGCFLYQRNGKFSKEKCVISKSGEKQYINSYRGLYKLIKKDDRVCNLPKNKINK